VDAAAPVPIEKWNRLKDSRMPALKDLLLAPQPRFELSKVVSRRGRSRRRGVKFDYGIARDV
jgi:hypothetical protein